MKIKLSASGSPDFQHTGREPHILREIFLTHHAILADFSRVMGMPAARFGILRTIAVAHPERIGPMEIARRLGVNAAAITRQLQSMESDGLILRQEHLNDARRSQICLTETGRETFEQIHRRNHQFEERLCTMTGAADLAAAVKVLSEIRKLIPSFLPEDNHG